ncbi:hypothetical protein [Microbulbifer sp. PSTR4-B]|uniref:hypothetical protein n=1 Tax=unclassified Microbulbifer TaxID=2619833 RepID=UPI00403B1846
MEDERSVIVTFDAEKVEAEKESMLRIFTEMDDGIELPIEHKKIAAQALYERILSKKEIHLLAMEADYIKLKAPSSLLDISYYE